MSDEARHVLELARLLLDKARAEECKTCHGEGGVTVGGTSLNPSSGVHVSDPQMAHDEPCRDCAANE